MAVSKRQWLYFAANRSGLWFFVCFLRRLLKLGCPWRHDSVHARVGDGLAEVLAEMSGDGDEGTAYGRLPVKHALRFIDVLIAELENSGTQITERIL